MLPLCSTHRAWRPLFTFERRGVFQRHSEPCVYFALNLLALLFYQDRWQQAAELAWRLRLNNQQVSSAEALARRLREGVNAAPTAMSPTPELAETGEQR